MCGAVGVDAVLAHVQDAQRGALAEGGAQLFHAGVSELVGPEVQHRQLRPCLELGSARFDPERRDRVGSQPQLAHRGHFRSELQALQVVLPEIEAVES
eukprot:79428-Rhodomonas_salina.1